MAWEVAKDLTIEDIDVEPPKAHEVRIEIYYTGVCHTGSLFALASQNDVDRVQTRTHFPAKIPKALSPSSLATRAPASSNLLVKVSRLSNQAKMSSHYSIPPGVLYRSNCRRSC